MDVFTLEFKIAILETFEAFTDEEHPGMSSERIANALLPKFPEVTLDLVKLCAKQLRIVSNKRSGLMRPDKLEEGLEFLRSMKEEVPTVPAPAPAAAPPPPLIPQNNNPSLLGVILPAG